ncbi:helix-turn-helix domain-containing protein [Paenibacillus azoreducens]|uniref:helix-turn-helix domain-containing protein n=1 Tax=Paenibacillus azoreducens TaxID=116718 RepID=UPI0039F5AF42
MGKFGFVNYDEQRMEKSGVRGILNQREAHIGVKIRNLRKKMGWTQEELAYRAQIDTSYLGQIERGKKRSPTIRIIGKIADALSVDSSLLLEPSESASTNAWEEREIFNIPEQVAHELKRSSFEEQMMYYKILQVIRQFMH